MEEILLNELQSNNIPDLSLFLKSESLKIIPNILNKLLETEKKIFKDTLNKNDHSITFNDIIRESPLSYLRRILNHLNSVENNKTLRDIISQFRGKLQDFYNEIEYSKEFYKILCDFQLKPDLTSDQKRILERYIKEYQQRGINLNKEQQNQLKKINKQYIEIGEKFQNNVIDDQSQFSYHFNDKESLTELPEAILKKAEALAGEKGGYTVDADPTSMGAILKYCSDQKIRQTFYDQSQQWATKGKHNNRKLVLKLLEISKKKAQILGYQNAGELFLRNTMAEAPEKAKKFIKKISKKALTKTKQELSMLEKDFDLGKEKIKPYDLSYYIRKYKEKKYDIKDEEIKEYFEFENVLNRLHAFTKKFFGIELHLIKTTENERRYEVHQGKQIIAYYMLDAFYRKGKRPGARADYLKEKTNKKLPIIVNVCNFQKNEHGKTLLYLGNVETLFHEFGHAIHAMVSESPYAELSGFNIERDFVELPSQLMENRVSERESLKDLSKHYITGEPLPDKIINKLNQLKTFMMGYRVARQNELALLDLELYTIKPPKTIKELDNIILKITNKYSPFQRGKKYKMYCSFLHIFGGGYESKYYSYMWADQLQADIFSRIKEYGIFNGDIGKKYSEKILNPGSRKPAKELFIDFMEREPSEKALMIKYGLIGK